jgi:hypothetical protein
MKVTCIDKEIETYIKSIQVEVEGETYNIDLTYDRGNYSFTFIDNEGKAIEMPEWADKYDNATRSLDYDLDVASGMWEFCPAIPSEMEVTV